MKKRMIPILCGLLTLCLLLAGCSGKTQSAAYDSAPREVNQMKSDNSYSAAEESSYDAPAAGLQEADQDSSSLIGSVPGRKIIKNADMNVETRTFDEFIAYVNKTLGELGGYIQSSSLNGSRYGREDLRYASITLRVPAEKLESFLSMIEGEGNVTYRNIYTDDVTLSYVDTESHLKALRTEQETLLGLLEKAETVENIIAIQSRLSKVRYEIESYESRLRTYDDQIDYSTVYLNVSEVERETQVKEETPGEEISRRLSQNWEDLKEDVKRFGINFVSDLPYILVWVVCLGAAAVVIVLIIRGSRKRRARKLAAGTVQNPATQTQSKEQKDK